MNEFKRCLEQSRLVKVPKDTKWIEKEQDEAEYDLSRAKSSFHTDDYKWSIIQSYYSMFHGAKALVVSEGYREKSHQCLIVALRELYVKTERLDEKVVNRLEDAMDLRHQADYGLEYSSEEAKILIEHAEEFLEIVEKLLL